MAPKAGEFREAHCILYQFELPRVVGGHEAERKWQFQCRNVLKSAYTYERIPGDVRHSLRSEQGQRKNEIVL